MDKLHDDILKGTQGRLKSLNEIMYRTVTDYYSNNLSIGDDVIKYNSKNIGIVEKLIGEIKKLDDPLKRLGGYILKGVQSLLGATAKQLNTVDVRAIRTSKPVFERLLGHAATNIETNLNMSTAFNEIKEVSMRLMSRPEGISLRDLRNVLQERIVDKSMSEKYFSRWTFDIYNQYQRAGADQVRKKLNLKHARYSGGLIESSRPFCVERNGQVFSEDEIMDWENEDFEGRPEPYDPIIDCGGYNCRHRLEWITEEMFDELKSDDGTNDANDDGSGFSNFASVNDAENSIRSNKKETAFVFDSNGNKLFEKLGNKKSVSFSDDEAKLFKNAIFTHNHPSGRSFSIADILTSSKFGVNEMRAVSKSESYFIKPIENVWPSVRTIQKTYDKYFTSVQNEFWKMIQKGEMSIADANFRHHHEVWTLVSKELNLKYERRLFNN